VGLGFAWAWARAGSQCSPSEGYRQVFGLCESANEDKAGWSATLTYYAFPKEYWRRIRTNNPLERLLRKIRRRTRVVGAFPDGQSALKTYVAALIKALGKLA
jgi:transposase-like protein